MGVHRGGAFDPEMLADLPVAGGVFMMFQEIGNKIQDLALFFG
jgi:hypothetical protein